MPRCAGAPAQPVKSAPPAAASPPRNLRRSIPITPPVVDCLSVLLKKRELRIVAARRCRRLEPRRHRRAMALAGVEVEPLARNVETLPEQLRKFSAAAHAAAEGGIVIAPAAHFVHAAHHVLRFQRVV